MNINEFPDQSEDGASIRDGAALLAISYDGQVNGDGERLASLSIYENGEKVDSVPVTIEKSGRVRQRDPDGFYRAQELFEVMKREVK